MCIGLYGADVTSLASGAATHVGRVRRSNQDRFLATETTFAVADGLGGHAGGEVASRIAVETIAGSGPVVSIHDLMCRVHDTNTMVVAEARAKPTLFGMGTTLCVLALLIGTDPPRLGVANVGDSRLYRHVDGYLHRCTIDHSLVEEWVRSGRLSREQAAAHPRRNVVTRALGFEQRVAVDAWELQPVVGDRYLICSDGLFGEVSEDEIVAVLVRARDPAEAADALVLSACKHGGGDNVTAVVVDITETACVQDPPDDRVLTRYLDATNRNTAADP